MALSLDKCCPSVFNVHGFSGKLIMCPADSQAQKTEQFAEDSQKIPFCCTCAGLFYFAVEIVLWCKLMTNGNISAKQTPFRVCVIFLETCA